MVEPGLRGATEHDCIGVIAGEGSLLFSSTIFPRVPVILDRFVPGVSPVLVTKRRSQPLG